MKKKRGNVCVNCGKGVQFVNLVSHAKNRVKSIRKPNLRVMRVVENGKTVKRKLCMKCLKKAERPHKQEVKKVEEKKEAKK